MPGLQSDAAVELHRRSVSGSSSWHALPIGVLVALLLLDAARRTVGAEEVLERALQRVIEH